MHRTRHLLRDDPQPGIDRIVMARITPDEVDRWARDRVVGRTLVLDLPPDEVDDGVRCWRWRTTRVGPHLPEERLLARCSISTGRAASRITLGAIIAGDQVLLHEQRIARGGWLHLEEELVPSEEWPERLAWLAWVSGGLRSVPAIVMSGRGVRGLRRLAG